MLAAGSVYSSRLNRTTEGLLFAKVGEYATVKVMGNLAYSLRIAGYCWHCITSQEVRRKSHGTMAVWPSELRLVQKSVWKANAKISEKMTSTSMDSISTPWQYPIVGPSGQRT